MLYVDDTYFDKAYFDRCNALFAKNEILSACHNKRITVCLSDRAFWIALCLYIKSNGGSVFPLPMDTPIEAARRRAERSGSQYLLFGTDGETALSTIEAIATAGTTSPGRAASGNSTAPSDSTTPSDGSASLIQMSSGTTGEPKYIARTWESIDTEIASYIRHFRAGDTMTPIVACPINHSYGLICGVLVALERGLAPVVIRNLNPKYILRKLSEAASPLLYSSPTLITAITLLTRQDDPIFAVMTSGTLMQKSWFEGVRKKVRHVHQQYGCSEVGCITLGENIGGASQLGSPLPHIELMAGSNVAEPKEILVKLPGGEMIQTRDLGYMNQGNLHFVSRLDDMINVAGLNVYPSEVEEIVLTLPGVTDAVAFKRRQGLGNDQVCLYFVATQSLPHQLVREWCAQHLASHQVPMNITQLDVIPKLPNGKVSRKALAEAAH